MPKIENLPQIEGVQLVTFDAFGDNRGRFMETFRREWFPQRSWDIVQCNRSESQAGVLRGLHYHFNQVDYWTVMAGTIRVGLADLRAGSPTRGAACTFELSSGGLQGLFIPIGVAHGFVSLTEVTLFYIVDNYYTGGDEFGVAWNDPALGLDWGVPNPMISKRDATNPLVKDIPLDRIPV